MPLKFTNRANALTILWTSEDATQTASFQVPKQATDKEKVESLVKALGFLVAKTGAAVPSIPTTMTPADTAPTAIPTGTPPSPGPRVQMMPPASLSDRPSDGGRPNNAEFWESMPTTAVPQNLAVSDDGGWEMMPPEEME